MSLLVVCGLQAEAAIAQGPDVRTVVGGGREDGLRARIQAAIADRRPDGVLSFGVAGALSHDLVAGELVVAEAVIHAGRLFDADPPWREALTRKLKAREALLAASSVVVADRRAKSELRRAGGGALTDMESGVAAELAHAHGVPFCAVRAVSDDARTALPPSAVAGMGPEGEVRVGRVLRSLARRPHDLPGLVRVGRGSAKAFEALRRARATLGEDFAFTA